MLQKVNGRSKIGHNSHGRRSLYRSYVFKDKDPVIDELRTIVEDEGVNYKKLSAISGVSQTTLTNWFEGETKRPQYATITAVTMACGYATKFVKHKAVNYEREFKKAQEEIAAEKERERRRQAREARA